LRSPDHLAGGERLAAPSPLRLGPSGLGSPFALPWKNPAGAHGSNVALINNTMRAGQQGLKALKSPENK